jgi:hypothetical protein
MVFKYGTQRLKYATFLYIKIESQIFTPFVLLIQLQQSFLIFSIFFARNQQQSNKSQCTIDHQ